MLLRLGCVALILASRVTAVCAQPLSVVTIAGATTGGGYIDDVGTRARFSMPRAVVVDPSGNAFVVDEGNHVIRRIAPDGTVTTVAGQPGVSGNADGQGSAARFNEPSGIAIDGNGTIYVADTNNHAIRAVSLTGAVTTFAGVMASPGTSDGVGSAARFTYPYGISVDSAGNLYVADTSNHTVRRITPARAVSTLAGQMRSNGSGDGFGSQARFYYPFAVTNDAAGNVYVADTYNHTIRKVTPEGRVTTIAGQPGEPGYANATGAEARFNYPWGLAVDRSTGDVYVADSENEAVRRITPSATVTTVAGSPGVGSRDGFGSDARFAYPNGVTFERTGSLLIADAENHAIRRVTIAGQVTTFAGSKPSSGTQDGPGTVARFSFPWGVATDDAGNIYVAELTHVIRKISPDGLVTRLAGIHGASGSADGTGSVARFNTPFGVAVDPNGNVFVADTENHAIRKVTPTGTVTTFAGQAGVAGSTDGSGSQARFDAPFGVATDSRGNVYVADTYNHSIRMIEPAGVVTTFAGSPSSFSGSADGIGTNARFRYPTGIATDAARNIYVADWGNHTIRKITQAGAVTTVAGSPGVSGQQDGNGSAARFDNPDGIAATADGTLYVADTDNHTIRRISPTGVVTTVAGRSRTSGNVDGNGADVRFTYPSGVAVHADGKVAISDTHSHAIKIGTVPPPTIIRFEVVPEVIEQGQSCNLVWSWTDGASATIDNGIGSVSMVSGRTLRPSVTTTYTLTVVGAGGTTTAKATVYVRAGRRRAAGR